MSDGLQVIIVSWSGLSKVLCDPTCISTPALFLMTCDRLVRASSPCWVLSVGNIDTVTRSDCLHLIKSSRSTVNLLESSRAKVGFEL